MEIRAEEISQIIRKQIEEYDQKVSVMETGTVLTTGDGIARVYGLSGAMAGEMLEFPHGVFGIALNLEEDSVGAVLLGDFTKITSVIQLSGAALTEQAPAITTLARAEGLEGHARAVELRLPSPRTQRTTLTPQSR